MSYDFRACSPHHLPRVKVNREFGLHTICVSACQRSRCGHEWSWKGGGKVEGEEERGITKPKDGVNCKLDGLEILFESNGAGRENDRSIFNAEARPLCHTLWVIFCTASRRAKTGRLCQRDREWRNWNQVIVGFAT